MLHAPGIWRFLCNAFRTEPRAWSEEAITAFTNNRVTKADLDQILAGHFHNTEDPTGDHGLPSLIIHIHKEAPATDQPSSVQCDPMKLEEPIVINVAFPPEMVRSIIHGFMDNFPEASLSVQCEQFDYDSLTYTFWDDDEGKRHVITEKELLQAFKLLFTDHWPMGFVTPPATACEKVWDTRFWNHADAAYSDAFAQLAIFGKVIYG